MRPSAFGPRCLWTVSYTHLDVYKRQPFAMALTRPSGVSSSKARSASPVFVARSTRPVSYTHLNVFIGIVQELRVKRTLDKVTLLSGSTACVVRGGRTHTVPTDELVLDVYKRQACNLPGTACRTSGHTAAASGRHSTAAAPRSFPR